MKKNLVILVSATMLLASCGTYAGAGAGQGAWFGGLIGSCIGGITGGPRGHDVGTLLGMAGGAIAGAAIGSAADNERETDMEQYRAEKARLAANRRARQQAAQQTTTTTTVPENYNYEQGAQQDSGFDSSNGGDDRIDLDLGNTTTKSISVDSLSQIEPIVNGTPDVQIRNARFVDASGDNVITRGECATIVFEIFNAGTAPAYNLQPTVLETTGNKHILVSPSILIENLGAGKGVRYTARVIADKSLKAGEAKFSVAIVQGTETISKVMNFTVQTAK